MKFEEWIALLVLVGAVLSSSLAGLRDPCGAHDVSSDTAQTMQQNPSGQHHYIADESLSEGKECPCCDNCVVACVMSACNPAAVALATIETNFPEPGRFVPLVTPLHDEPILLPPFRPPIQIA